MNDKTFRYVKNPLGYYTVEPLPSPSDLESFYRDVYYQKLPSSTYQDEYSREEMAYTEQRSAIILHAVMLALKRPVAGASLVELGAGEGFFLDAAIRAGFDVTGVDFSSHGVEKFNPHVLARMRLGDVYKIIDDLISENKKPDVIVLQNVLEHVLDPDELLENVRNLAKTGTLLVVKVPNDFSRLQRVAQERGFIDREFWFAPPAHLHYFTLPTLKAILNKWKFSPRDAFADFPVDWFLFHPGSNYVADPSVGKAAHRARIMIDVLLGENGTEPYYRFCQALADCGMGRDIAVLAQAEN